MKDYLVTLVFNLNGITITSLFCRAENENGALAKAFLISDHPANLLRFQSVQEVHPDFCVLNHASDIIADNNVIAMKVAGIKKNSDLTQDLIKLAKKYDIDGIVKALSD